MAVPGLSLLGLMCIRGFISILPSINPIIIINQFLCNQALALLLYIKAGGKNYNAFLKTVVFGLSVI